MNPIQFSQTDATTLTPFDTLILPVFSNTPSSELIKNLGQSELVKQLVEQEDFLAKAGQTLSLVAQTPRIILVGLGEDHKLTDKTYISAIQAAIKALNATAGQKVLNALTAIDYQTADWRAFQNTLETQKSFYDYQHPSRGQYTPAKMHLKEMTLLCPASTKIIQAQATAQGMMLTRNLANMPSNFCTPTYLAETAQKLGQDYGFEVNILDREEMIKMGMGAFMAVAQGTDNPPKLICLSYQGAAKEEAPIALVGKGVTFDTGGISLKPGAAMDEMKYDMGGAATVLGTFKALGELKPKLNVVAVIASTDNMPSGTAIKPGDVVTSLSGQTIEILNTDAEGRLVLCDALTYVQRTYQPKKIIDMATLTGACIIALGHDISAVLGNEQQLVNQLLEAGKTTYDRFWQMPLSQEYDEQLKSNFADMANIGGRPAGTITAAQFLGRFIENETPWAHLDIAGTAWTSGANKGATGRPVPGLVEFLISQVDA